MRGGEALYLPNISLKIQIIENASDSNDAMFLDIQESSEIGDCHKYSVNFCFSAAGMIQARYFIRHVSIEFQLIHSLVYSTTFILNNYCMPVVIGSKR